MHIKQSLLRVAAAATVTAFMTLGSGFSAQTATATEDSTSTQEAEQGEAGQAAASEKRAAAEDKQSQNTEDQQSEDQAAAESDDDAAEDSSTDETDTAPSQGSKAQGPKTTGKSANANASGNAADKSANGNGHTPVTVCHSLGNGGYIEITFDENALEKHVDNHDDLYPVPADGCPAPAPVEAAETDADGDRVTVCHILGNGSYNLLTFDDSALPAHLAHGDHAASSDDDADCGIAVAGVSTSTPSDSPQTSATASGNAVEQAEELGVEAERAAGSTVTAEAAGANRAPAVVAPAAGILPATGAGDYALVLLGGVGLLAAGAALLARRRLQGDS